MTRRSRGIHAAWHFWHAVSFGGEGGMRKVGLCGIHPLTRRYMPLYEWLLRILAISRNISVRFYVIQKISCYCFLSRFFNMVVRY
ncbi:TPA: DUF3265 domain-containing protein [Vibrio vulnificus]|nr:DUF3265 domain-containing protein [Vibrio vulnificus]